jgi:DhnA family fructose-bisphosphate aldolase class Ia
MTKRVQEILSWYASENPGVLTNLSRLLNHGTLAGTGRCLILPVDQGFEHGPARSFAPNPAGYNPLYHFQLAIDAGCNAYAAQIAAQLGAHVIKVKLPTEHIEQAAAKKVYESKHIPIKTMAERVRHVVQSAFDGRRIVIFSGGAAKEDDKAIYDEVRGIRDGGGFGSIIGRNSFQRKKDDALNLLRTITGIYAGTIP